MNRFTIAVLSLPIHTNLFTIAIISLGDIDNIKKYTTKDYKVGKIKKLPHLINLGKYFDGIAFRLE